LKKSSDESIELCEKMAEEFLSLCPGAFIRNCSVTTSSIYIKTPDGFSLRVGDHNGKKKYTYKWNLLLGYSKKGFWEKDRGVWRFYCSNAETIANEINKNIQQKKSIEPLLKNLTKKAKGVTT